MKILADRKIKGLFCSVIFITVIFFLCRAALEGMQVKYRQVFMAASFPVMGLLILAVMFRYFRKQNALLEDAVQRIREYAKGSGEVRLVCDEEGELYRLFHEVNTLVNILNAHAENERRAKTFIKETISDISHQLKTPLAALEIYNGIMQEEAGESPSLKEFAALSEQELDRIESLVQNLLKIAKLDAGTAVMEKRMENLSEMMDKIERSFRYRAKQEKKRLQFSGDAKAALFCDREWMTEAVSNIVNNAFDHTGEGDTISIEWRQRAPLVQITIKDSGKGIHPEDLPHIFKRFYRSRFSQDTRGIGLGLPLAKAVIDAHSGVVEADSEPGRGTVFTIDFLIPSKL